MMRSYYYRRLLRNYEKDDTNDILACIYVPKKYHLMLSKRVDPDPFIPSCHYEKMRLPWIFPFGYFNKLRIHNNQN
jgi:hypothetical protein